MWQLKDRRLMTDNMLVMPIHNVIVIINDQFKPIPILVKMFKHYALTETLIVIHELNILLHMREFILGIRILFFQSKKAGTSW